MNIKKKDIAWNYLGIIMAMGSNFILLPFLLNYLDSELLGLWYVFLSVGSLVNLFDFGFSPTFARNIAYAWSGAKKLRKKNADFIENTEPNFKLLKIVVKTCKYIYLLISIIALILLLTIGTYYISNISSELETLNHYIAWFIYSIAVFLNLFFGYNISLLRGVGAIEEMNKATIISRFIQIVFAILLLYLGYGIIGVSIAYLIKGLSFRLIASYSFNNYNNIGEKLRSHGGNIEKKQIIKIIKIVWPNTWRDGLVSLSNYLSNQATVIISPMFLTLTETGIYSISLQIVIAIATISGALYTAYQPALQSAYIEKNKDKSLRLMSTAMTGYIMTFLLGVLGTIYIGLPVLEFLKPDTVFSIPILIGMSIYMFLLKYHSYYASYISNTNEVPYLKSFIISSVMGIIIVLSLFELTNLGVWSLIIGPALVQLIYNNWFWPLKVMKSLNTNPFEMFSIGLKNIKEIIRV
jgi:O-antigen/teichoic acid export membrane protein